MNAIKRKKQIMEMLMQRSSVDVVSLSQDLGTSKVTIRNDLDNLEKKGLLVRTRGGAILAESQDLVRLITNTLHECETEKRAIAKLAAKMIQPNMNIIIDSGSTTIHLAKEIVSIPLTVATNSMLVVQGLVGHDNLELLVAGGVVRQQSMATMGNDAKHCFEQIHADILFLGASGFSLTQGITCSNLIEADTKKSMIRSSAKVVLMVDSTKANISSLARICGWDSIDVMVTDNRLAPELRAAIEAKGVEVITD